MEVVYCAVLISEWIRWVYGFIGCKEFDSRIVIRAGCCRLTNIHSYIEGTWIEATLLLSAIHIAFTQMYSLRSPAATILRRAIPRAASTSKPSSVIRNHIQRATYASNMDRSAGPPLTNPLNISKWYIQPDTLSPNPPPTKLHRPGSKQTRTSSNPPSTTTSSTTPPSQS